MFKPIFILWIALGLLGALFVFMIIRTLCCKKAEIETGEYKVRDFDTDTIVKHLSDAVQIPTVSMVGEFEGIDAPFFEYHKFLENSYPLIHKAAQKTIINSYSLVYRFKGKNPSLKPGAFLAHQDVVPAPEEGWEVPPFSGALKDGFVYGRGTQDMKGTMIALLEAMEKLLAEGFVPERDIFFCFGHDEEPSTEFGARYIVDWMKQQGIELEFVLDEGGTVIDGKMIGMDKYIGLIGICEKGNVNMRVSVEKSGGHASNPSKPAAAAVLAKALIKIDKHPMPAKWTNATKQLFKTLAPNMMFPIKFVLVNRDIFSPLLKFVFKKIPIANALISTTFAQTMLKGSNAQNVIPPRVEANINTRIITGVSRNEVVDYTQRLVGKNVKVEGLDGTEATPESPIDVAPYTNLNISIKQAFPNMITAPYMFIANDDARYFYPVCSNVYRFTPFIMTLDDQKRVHALNERVAPEAMNQAAQFFAQCLENMSK
jgi:Acetylornithine deacetylase/Succinyl-diaminopimelate desuccinylase and related deacylases